MKIFNNNFKGQFPLKIAFLCGSHYEKNDDKDKRNVFQSFIEDNTKEWHSIILEKKFDFTTCNKEYLSYDHVFLKNLLQIEELASLYADVIIVIHDSISTASEIGAFATNPQLSKKIHVLIPDKFSIDEDKQSAYMKLAFWRNEEAVLPEPIIYYPDIKTLYKSSKISMYYTLFHNNIIGENLKKSILERLDTVSDISYQKIRKRSFKVISKESNADYYIENDKIHIEIGVAILKMQLLSLMFDTEIRKELRIEKKLYEHINFLKKQYCDIIKNTITEIDPDEEINRFDVQISIKDTNCKLEQAIGYYVYMLQAIDLIKLEYTNRDKPEVRKFVFTVKLSEYEQSVAGLLAIAKTSVYGELVNNERI